MLFGCIMITPNLSTWFNFTLNSFDSVGKYEPRLDILRRHLCGPVVFYVFCIVFPAISTKRPKTKN